MLLLISNLTAGKTSFQGIDLLPYHAYGVQKYSLLGRDYPASTIIRKGTESNGATFLQIAKTEESPLRFQPAWWVKRTVPQLHNFGLTTLLIFFSKLSVICSDFAYKLITENITTSG